MWLDVNVTFSEDIFYKNWGKTHQELVCICVSVSMLVCVHLMKLAFAMSFIKKIFPRLLIRS